MNTQKQTINFLLHYAAAKMLAGSPARSAIQKASQAEYNRFRAAQDTRTVKQVDFIAGILSSLVSQLTRCNQVSELEQAMQYIESLEKGEVLIAQETGEVTPAPQPIVGKIETRKTN